MTINTDFDAWLKARAAAAQKALCVKRSDVDVFASPYAFGILAQPAIIQGAISNDEQLFARVRTFADSEPVVIVGHGWNQSEQFVATLTAQEFLRHWQGD